MQNNISQNHCTDEQLLASLDDELDPEAGSTIQAHLSRCWECRARLGDFERRAHSVAELLTDSSFLGPEKIAAAKNRFLASAGRLPQSDGFFSSLLRFRILSQPRLRYALGAAALVAVCLSLWAIRTLRAPNPSELVAQAVAEESALASQPIHQAFRLEMAQYKPARAFWPSDFEIWSDAANRRFTSKWKSGRGELLYAAWQPDATRHYLYDPESGRGKALAGVPSQQPEPFYLVAEDGKDLQAVKSRFEAWLSTREWRPITLAHDLSLFVAQEGALLQVNRNSQRLAITATSSRGGGKFSMTLDLDPSSKRLQVAEVRFRSPRSDVEIRLVAERNEPVNASSLVAATFTPDVPLAPAPVLSDRAIAAEAGDAAPVIPSSQVPFSTADFVNLEARVDYELHRLHACVGESIAVTPDAGGGLKVAGVVETGARRDEIVQGLKRLDLPGPIAIDIVSVAEAAARQPASKRAQVISSLAANGSAAEDQPSAMMIAKDKFPLDEYLETYFSNHPIPADVRLGEKTNLPLATPEQREAAFSSSIVSLSQDAYRQSWAIRRLAEEFRDTSEMNENSIRLVESMARDHARELQRDVQTLRNILGPVFPPGSDQVTPITDTTAEADWPGIGTTIFRKSDEINLTLFGLFATGSVPASNADGANGPAAERVVRNVLPRMANLESEISSLESLTLKGLRGNEAIASGGRKP